MTGYNECFKGCIKPFNWIGIPNECLPVEISQQSSGQLSNKAFSAREESVVGGWAIARVKKNSRPPSVTFKIVLCCVLWTSRRNKRNLATLPPFFIFVAYILPYSRFCPYSIQQNCHFLGNNLIPYSLAEISSVIR